VTLPIKLQLRTYTININIVETDDRDPAGNMPQIEFKKELKK